MTNAQRPTRVGIALIESVVSMAVLSLLLVTALSTVAASRRGQRWNSDTLRAQSLALDLMTEIIDQEYRDPDETPLWGPEPLELTGRPSWDDVDDYDGYKDAPPKDRAGAAIPGLSGWGREVLVEHVEPGDIKQLSGSGKGLKRITVTATRNGTTMSTLVALRSLAAAR